METSFSPKSTPAFGMHVIAYKDMENTEKVVSKLTDFPPHILTSGADVFLGKSSEETVAKNLVVRFVPDGATKGIREVVKSLKNNGIPFFHVQVNTKGKSDSYKHGIFDTITRRISTSFEDVAVKGDPEQTKVLNEDVKNLVSLSLKPPIELKTVAEKSSKH